MNHVGNRPAGRWRRAAARNMGMGLGWTRGALGLLALLAAWAVLSAAIVGVGKGVPTPWAVAQQIGHDGAGFYGPLIVQTGSEALRGYLAGNGLALACAVIVLLVPPADRVIIQLAIVSYCLPLVALGPILEIILSGDAPMVTMAALSVFFTTLVGALLGLRSADPAALDLVRACGGGRWQQVRRVRLAAALPSVFAALTLACPAALLGAIVGEYFGRVDTGLGVAMINSEQQLDVARTWGIALISGVVAGMGYGLVATIARALLPWARVTTLLEVRA